MAITNIQTALAGLLFGGLVVGGASTLVQRKPAEPTPIVQQAAVPAAAVPGYAGPVYDAQGKLIGYAPANSPYTPSAEVERRYATPAPMAVQTAAAANPGSRTTVSRPRSKEKSALIVLGSAGAGAAIGGLAGGGKGAGIGAISGGTAGLIYDRMTHNKKQ